MKVWILFSEANEYNQPKRAFEEIFWEKPSNVDETWKDCDHKYFWYECFEKEE